MPAVRRRAPARCRCSAPTSVRPRSSPISPAACRCRTRTVSLYNEKLAKSPVEKLLPPPEQPLPRPAPPPVKPAAAPPIADAAARGSPAEAGPAPAAAARARAPQADRAATAAPQPRRRPPSRRRRRRRRLRPRPSAPGTAAGAVQVRLGSLRSPEAAREEWQRLKRANGDLLGNLRANAVSVDLGDKGIYYRIMAGRWTRRRPSGCATR